MTPPLTFFSDVHAHSRTGADILTSIEPPFVISTPVGEAWYSVGIHPWSTAEPVPCRTLAALRRLADDERVAAIGECGLDDIRGGDREVQEKIFLLHARIAERVGKPLIIHCVRRYGRMLELHRQMRPTVPWMIHGFTGKPELARQLAAEGFLISVGRCFNPLILDVVPPQSLLRETDL